MFTVLGSPRRCCDGLTRRETLKVGTLSALGGFGLPELLQASTSGQARPGKAKSVILLYLLGGAATQDMFDMKPDAPQEIRGEFRPDRDQRAGRADLRTLAQDGALDAQNSDCAFGQSQGRLS